MSHRYVTVLSTPDYLPGVLALYQSLKEAGSVHRLVVCIVENTLGQESIAALDDVGLETRIVGSIQNPNISGERRFKTTYSKLRVFGLDQ